MSALLSALRQKSRPLRGLSFLLAISPTHSQHLLPPQSGFARPSLASTAPGRPALLLLQLTDLGQDRTEANAEVGEAG